MRFEMNLSELKKKSMSELMQLAGEYDIENPSNLRKQELIFALLQSCASQNGSIYGEGVLEILPDGFGFLRSPMYSYMPGPDDIYVSPSQIRRFGLRKGDVVSGQIRPPKEGERYFALLRVEEVGLAGPEASKNLILFDNLTPIYPDERFLMENGADNFSARVIDLLTPIGKGQRGLIVAPPRTGKTMLLQCIANSISTNHPDAFLIVLLIDERPEEVTDMERTVKAEVVSSTFDESPSATSRSPRWSARRPSGWSSASQTSSSFSTPSPGLGAPTTPSPRPRASHLRRSGGQRIATPEAVLRRRPQHRGGRQPDDHRHSPDRHRLAHGRGHLRGVQGHGQHGDHLDRHLSDKRVFPAININRSGTRKEELLLSDDILNRVIILRKLLAPMSPIDSMDFLLDKMKGTKSNQEFLNLMNK
jgi:transcription termination factor Rho